MNDDLRHRTPTTAQNPHIQTAGTQTARTPIKSDMTKYCNDALQEVYSYLDQELPTFTAWRVRRHLKACEGCGAAYGFEEKLRVVIRLRLREDPPPEFLARLRSAIDHERDSL